MPTGEDRYTAGRPKELYEIELIFQMGEEYGHGITTSVCPKILVMLRGPSASPSTNDTRDNNYNGD